MSEAQKLGELICRRLVKLLLDLSDGFVDALSEVVDIFGVKAGHLKQANQYVIKSKHKKINFREDVSLTLMRPLDIR